MSQSQVWKKKIGGLANRITEQRQSWLNPTVSTRKAAVPAALGQQKAGMKRREN